MSLVEKRLGRRVADLRKLAGMTQARLAERVDVSTETISRLERGSAIPSLARIEEIAGAIGVELPELFRFRERPSPRDRAIDLLFMTVRKRNADDIEVVADLATRIFRRWR